MGSVQEERRRHTRFRVSNNILFINQDTLAEVIDISTCGMACRCLTRADKPITEFSEIELLNYDLDISIEGLPCRIVRSSKTAITDSLLTTLIMHFSIEFKGLTNKQRRQLDRFIEHNNHLAAGLL
jgi:hypothetical protein